MATRFGRAKSRNDQLRSNDAWTKFYAGAADKVVPQELLNNLPPKRSRIVRPVDHRPVGPSEHQLQSTVVAWWWHASRAYELPYFALFAIPNGGARDMITGAHLKAEGVRAGAPDLMLAVGRQGAHGLYIEMKVHPRQPSESQVSFIEYLNKVNYRAVVHWSADTAIAEIKDYLK